MAGSSISDIQACVFDAYGTLLDVTAAARKREAALGDKAGPLAALWRTKQLEYSWLRSLMDEYDTFWKITGDALDYAMSALGLEDGTLRADLLSLYFELDAYPEVKETLAAIKSAGMKTAILSNGSPDMLTAAVDSAGIRGLLDDLISVDELKVYKPHPSVYKLGADRMKVERPSGICFMSANGWDVAGAANFGYRVVWVNRAGQPRERLPGDPDAVIETLAQLPALLSID